MKVEVFDPQNAVLASTIVKANGNANGKAGAYLSGTLGFLSRSIP